jgi:16S rRNA (uracil1498-N3)-methyltransferase
MSRARVRISPTASGALVSLPRESAHHVAHVLRIRAGEDVVVFDGTGREALAIVERVDDEGVGVRVGEWRLVATSGPRVHLVVGLLKGEKFDWCIEKATELGVAAIYPASTEHAIVSLEGARAHARVERWRRIAEAAARQSERADVPPIAEIAPLDAQIADVATKTARRALCQERAAAPQLADWLRDGAGEDVALLVGPEGGWSSAEIERAIAAGFAPVGLGPRILRAETAAIAAVALATAVGGRKHE